MKTPYTVALILLLAASAVVLAPTNLQANAKIRVVHMSPDAPSIDIRFDGDQTPSIGDLRYQDASETFEFPAGEHFVRIGPVGQAPFINEPYQLNDDSLYTVFIVGTVSPQTIKLRIAASSANESASDDSLRVRVYNALAGDDEVTVGVEPESGSSTAPVALAFASATLYEGIGKGGLAVSVSGVGESSKAGRFQASFNGGQVMTIVLNGLASDPGGIEASILFDNDDAEQLALPSLGFQSGVDRSTIAQGIRVNYRDGLLAVTFAEERFEELHITLCDVSGRSLISREFSISGSDLNVPIEALASGVYLVMVRDVRSNVVAFGKISAR